MSEPYVGTLPIKTATPPSINTRLRRLWLNVHFWIGLGFTVLLIPISLSGALLVCHDHLEALVNPDRYAVTQGQAQPPSALLASASAALGRGFEPVVVRMPESAGWPATVMAREQRRSEDGGRPRLLTVNLDIKSRDGSAGDLADLGVSLRRRADGIRGHRDDDLARP